MQYALNDALQSIQSNSKANQIGRNHHENVTHASDTAQHAVRCWSVLPLALGKQGGSSPFRYHEQHNQPAPNQQTQLDVVPQCHERKHHEEGQDRSRSGSPVAERRAAERNVDVPDQPPVVRAVPCSPEELCAVVVAYTTDHVFRRVNSVDQ